MSIAPWWLEPLATAASIIVGASMIVWQQRTSARTEIKRKLFEELRVSLGAANDAVSESGGYVFGIPSHVDLARSQQKAGQPGRTPLHRFEKMLDLQRVATNKTVEAMTVLSSHRIVCPHFELFRQALACALEDTINSHQALIPAVGHMIPFDEKADGSLPYNVYTDAQASELRQRAMAYWETANVLTSYIEDILTEAQNVLLLGTFKSRVAPRQPADPRYWVLRTRDKAYLEKLRGHFFEQHPAALRHRAAGITMAGAALRDLGKA